MKLDGQFLDLKEFRLPEGFRGRNPLIVQLWWMVQSTLFAWSPQFMYGWRRMLLRCFGASVGNGAVIRPSVRVTYPWKVTIGDQSWIGDDVVIYSLGDIKIGDNVVISQKSYLCAGTHDYQSVDFPIMGKRIVVEDQCWIAADVFVGPGVQICSGVVVGARSTVLRNIEHGGVFAGHPLRYMGPLKAPVTNPS